MKSMASRIIGGVVLFFFLLPAIGNTADLQKIETETAKGFTAIDLYLSKNVRYSTHTLPAVGSNLNRCYVDLSSTQRLDSVPPWTLVDSTHLNKIRTGDHGSKLRVVFDLKDEYDCIFTAETNPSRIHVKIFDSTKFVQQSSPEKMLATTVTTAPEDNRQHPKQQPAQEQTSLLTSSSSEDTASIYSRGQGLIFDDIGATGKPDLSVWGWAEIFAAQDIDSEFAEDENLYRTRGRLGTVWDHSLTSGLSLQLKGTVDIDHIFYDAEEADDDTEVKLYETYIKASEDNWDVAIGKQRVRWGKSDQLSPVDSINPQDFRQSMAIDLEDRALPSWMVRSRWYGDSFGFEAILQPWFEKSELEYFDSDWALYRNLRQAISENPAVPLPLQNYASTLYVDEDKPSHTFENMSAGARLTLQTDQTDFAVSYHYGWETLPTITSFPVNEINYNGDPNTNAAAMLALVPPPTSSRIEATYNRKKTVGFEWETTLLDPFGFRGEIAHIEKIAYLNNDLTSKRKSTTHLVTGIDYTSVNEWYFNLQGSWQYIHDYEKSILYFDKNTIAVLGEISKPVWRGNLELSTKYNYILTDQSSYLQPSVILKYFPNVECEIGAMIYSGDGETLLGSYDQADQVYVKMKISF